MYRSGVEEPYNNLDHLLQEVLDLINSILADKEKIKCQQRSAENAKLKRDDFARSLLEPDEPKSDPLMTSVSNQELLQESQGIGEENIFIELVTDGEVEHQKLQDSCQEIQQENETQAEKQGEAQANIAGPSRKRKCRVPKNNMKKTTIQYLEEKNAAKLTTRKMELELESNRQRLEMEKLQFEKEKLAFDKDKFLLEKEERRAVIKLLEKQHILTSTLIAKITHVNIDTS